MQCYYRLKQDEFSVIVLNLSPPPLHRHALVWECRASHLHGKEDREAACSCECVCPHDVSPVYSTDSLCFCSSQVVDVAKAIINAIKDPDANGKTYALVG